MRVFLAAAVSSALLAGIAGAADAGSGPKWKRYYSPNYPGSPLWIADRQRFAATFDPTLYYVRDSNKIPFGTPTWWRQREFENSGGGP